MADSDASEKIYPASPRKRENARKEGQVAKSTEFVTLVTLFSSLLFIYLYRNSIFNIFNNYLNILYTNINQDINIALVPHFIKITLRYISPLLIVILIAAFLSNYFQVGLKMSLKVLQPNFKKISLVNGFKRLFSTDSLVELGKSLLKVIFVLYITYDGLKPVFSQLQKAYSQNIYNIYNSTFNALFGIVLKIALFLLILSIVDFIYKKYKFEKDLKMTRQEMLDEYKQDEGNPQVKQRQREFARTLTRRQIQKVKEATVLITNPTHFAIAIKYDAITTPIPKVLFKGVDEVAQMAKEIARSNNIPMVENRPLARALYAAVKEDDFIPTDMFDAVASVIAYVYTLNDQKK